MTGTFQDRTRELEELVGHGTLAGSVVVDQIYAQYQHEGLDLRHPEGGQAKYLEEPLRTHSADYHRRLANQVLDGGLIGAMTDSMEHLSGQVFEKAPIEFGDLKASGHPTVTDDGAKVYDRPPAVHRLSKEELRAKGHVRNLGLGN